MSASIPRSVGIGEGTSTSEIVLCSAYRNFERRSNGVAACRYENENEGAGRTH